MIDAVALRAKLVLTGCPSVYYINEQFVTLIYSVTVNYFFIGLNMVRV